MEGNRIGTDPSGSAPIPNGSQNSGAGVFFDRGASGNTVGGTTAGAGNIIANNNGFGVWLWDDEGPDINDSILGNTFFSNSRLGIALGSGLTVNSPGGPHNGSNLVQNYPVITAVATTAGRTELQGTLNGAPKTAFRLEFFANFTADASGYGQGQTFLGFSTVTTSADGYASFDTTLPNTAGAGPYFSATATDPAGNTSEFAQDFKASAAVNPLVVTTTADSEPGSLRAAITFANSNPGADTITFAIPGAGVHTITPLSPLPLITGPVMIDGYSQPGAAANTLAQGDNAAIMIELSGTNAGTGADGLVISGGNSTIRGLAINGFSGGAGIHLTTVGGNKVVGDHLGTDPTGTLARPDRVGVQVETAQNTIGGTTAADRDVVSANTFIEVYLLGATATGNLVEGDFVGTNSAGGCFTLDSQRR